jgi:hypothetical protein
MPRGGAYSFIVGFASIDDGAVSGGTVTDLNVAALVAHLREAFGEGFRGCVVYDGDDRDIRFVRSDLEGAPITSRLRRVEQLYEAERAVRDAEPEDQAFGPLYASTHVFDGAVVVHFLTPSGAAVGVSMDHGVSGDISTFIDRCLDVFYDGDVGCG